MEWHHFDCPDDFIGRCLEQVTDSSKLPAGLHSIAVLLPKCCTHCGVCTIACRDGGYQAISCSSELPDIDPAKCVGCSLCSLVCPVGAIKMSNIDKES
ncbi:MAG: 4Fe-4S binding protein [Desulfobulbaceae bacterium]|nr:4Fe-4S binding protein [Desulfobulbaceae bacterium]